MKPRFSIVSVYGTSVPTRPPSVCVAGVTRTAYGGAIGVTNGEPDVENPPAAVAFVPSFTTDSTRFLSASATETVRCTVTDAPAPSVGTDHETTPSERAPPPSADTKLVFAGIGSVIVTPVASALPMFRSVRV